MITRKEILMNRDKDYPLTNELEENLEKLLLHLNNFRKIYNKPMVVSSGYRPIHHNKQAGGAKKSNHLLCLACDFFDYNSELDKFCFYNQDILSDCNLYLEHPKWTKGWCHLQIKPPKSHSRVFIPSANQPDKNKYDNLFK